MAKHVGFFLLVCFIFSAPFGRTYGAANNKQRKELDFADIQKHFESMTSASTSMGDIKDAVLPFLNNYRTKRSSGVDIAGTDMSQLKSLSRKVRNLDVSEKAEKILKHMEDFVAKVLKHIRKVLLPSVKILKLEKPFETLEEFIIKLLKPLGINLTEDTSVTEPSPTE